MKAIFLIAFATFYFSGSAHCRYDPNFADGHSTIVHLFEWKWNDIAEECERFLGPKGFGGVQISPPNENLAIPNRPWWERYQPMSYKLNTRSGNEQEFADMCKRCNKVGVRIYADAVINHMTAAWPDNTGTGGSTADFDLWEYYGVPYNKRHFNSPVCTITNYEDPKAVRNCQLYGLKDLNQTNSYVRDQVVDYMNRLIHAGVAGFRLDGAKHMWPEDLARIYGKLDYLNIEHGFKNRSKPYIYQEVIDFRTEPIKREEYINLGAVTEFLYGYKTSEVYRSGKLSSLKNWGPESGFLQEGALVFIDNHDNQRGHGAGGDVILNYKHRRGYKAMVAFMLAHPYGEPRLMSSFAFDDSEVGPPMDENENTISPTINEDGSCGSGWVCEHRWNQIYNMVAFRNAVAGTKINNWWDNGRNQIAFCRGNKGFIALNNEPTNMNKKLQTCLPTGTYCDIITGGLNDGKCTGKVVEVDDNGMADIEVEGYLVYKEAVLAIFEGSKLN